MKKAYLKKLVGVSLAVCMLGTNFVFANAAEAEDQVVYSVQDIAANDGSVINTTMSDIENEHWNMNALGDVSPEVYKDFPMKIDSHVGNYADMSLDFLYLKTISANDSVTFTVVDENGQSVLDSAFETDQYYLNMADVPMNKTYTLTIDESIDGVEKTYTAYIDTFYTQADFPSNVMVNGLPASDSPAQATWLAVTERNKDMEIVDNSDPNVEEILLLDTPEPLYFYDEHINEFYDQLESNKLYNIFTRATSDGVEQEYSGFISKQPEYAGLGIFVPTYHFRMSAAPSIRPLAAESGLTGLQVKTQSIMYGSYTPGGAGDVYITLPNDGKDYYIIAFRTPETGEYIAETLGNTKTKFEYWSSKDPAGIPEYVETVNIRGENTNARKVTSIMGDQVRYFVISTYDWDAGSTIFRIKYNDYNDTDNSVYAAYDEGRYLEHDNTETDKVNYEYDIDAYMLDNSISGYHRIVINNTNSMGTLDVNFYEYNPSNNVFNPTPIYTKTLNAGKSINNTKMYSARPSRYYFITVTGKFIGTKYDITTLPPDFPDSYEPNNTFATAKGLSGDDGNLTAALHKNDKDVFYFNTVGNDTIFAGVTSAYFNSTTNEDVYYNLKLYKNGSSTPVKTASLDGYLNCFEVSNLQPNTKYYLQIDYEGMDSDAYQPFFEYELRWDITRAQVSTPSAALTGNVVLSHTVGDDITSIDDLLDTVMQSLTCKEGSTVIDDSVAKADVKLYLNNSELTASTVNDLSAGTYSIVAKYKNVTATGGTITLNVTAAAADDKVQLDGITAGSPIDFIELDWLYCARDMANTRLAHEGKSASTSTINEIALMFDLDPDNFLVERRALGDVLKATYRFYTNGAAQTGSGFSGTTNANLLTIDQMYDKIVAGQGAIIQMVDFEHRTDMNYANYLFICGVNKTQQEFLVKDPITGTLNWVSRDSIVNGGYQPDNMNYKFSGAIIEASVQ